MLPGCHKDDDGHRWEMITAEIMKTFAIGMEQFDTVSVFRQPHPAVCILGLFG